MQHFDYKPHGVCPMNISFDLDGDTVHNVSFKGGCNGNLQAISRVVEGMTVEQIEGYFKGYFMQRTRHKLLGSAGDSGSQGERV